MDGAAGYPPRSAPHESRSPPTANLRSGRFVRAQARWVAARVPWSEGSAEALCSLGVREKKVSGGPPLSGSRWAAVGIPEENIIN
jgi:hypothetical protein